MAVFRSVIPDSVREYVADTTQPKIAIYSDRNDDHMEYSSFINTNALNIGETEMINHAQQRVQIASEHGGENYFEPETRPIVVGMNPTVITVPLQEPRNAADIRNLSILPQP